MESNKDLFHSILPFSHYSGLSRHLSDFHSFNSEKFTNWQGNRIFVSFSSKYTTLQIPNKQTESFIGSFRYFNKRHATFCKPQSIILLYATTRCCDRYLFKSLLRKMQRFFLLALLPVEIASQLQYKIKKTFP